MSNDTATPSALSADGTGSDFSVKSYDIAPEDTDLAASIANFDVIDDVPSPVTLTGSGNFKVPSRFSAGMLPGHLRQEVEQQLMTLPVGDARDQREHELTLLALRKNALDTRVRLGAGPGANKLQRETLQLARERQELASEADSLLSRLNEVVRIEVTGINPQTGEQLTKTVYRVEGEDRRQMQLRHADLIRHVDTLDGFEGDRRLKKALFESVEDEKAMRAQLARHEAAKVRAVEILEEEEVSRMANAYAANRRNNIG